jgi:hypothetical protein
MADAVPLMTETTYVDLVDRCTAAPFQTEFSPPESFIRVTIKERDY